MEQDARTFRTYRELLELYQSTDDKTFRASLSEEEWTRFIEVSSKTNKSIFGGLKASSLQGDKPYEKPR